MDKIRIICLRCNLPMKLMSQSGVDNKFHNKEIWSCTKCNLEVFCEFYG